MCVQEQWRKSKPKARLQLEVCHNKTDEKRTFSKRTNTRIPPLVSVRYTVADRCDCACAKGTKPDVRVRRRAHRIPGATPGPVLHSAITNSY